MTSPSRRELLAMTAAGSTFALAGCLGDSDDDGGPLGDENGDNGGGADPTDDDWDIDDEIGPDSLDAAPDESLTLLEALEPVDTYALDITVENEQGERNTASQVAHNGNYLYEFEVAGFETSYYGIDGTFYQVNMDGCQVQPDDPVNYAYVNPHQDFQHADHLTVEGITTVDGEEAYVFGTDEDTWIFYVSRETGYLLRKDWPLSPGFGEFHSINATDPIQLPDGCE